MGGCLKGFDSIMSSIFFCLFVNSLTAITYCEIILGSVLIVNCGDNLFHVFIITSKKKDVHH
jgi:hypothetical protein